MQQTYKEKTLEDWANFDFVEVDEQERPRSEEQTSLPDAFVETEVDVTAESVAEKATVDESKIEETESETGTLTPPPAYQGLEIPIGEVPIYQRPHMKALFFGSAALIVSVTIGMVFARGSNIQIGQQAETEVSPATGQEEKSEEDLSQEKLGELEGEVAFGTLKNRAQILEEQKKQQVLSGKLSKQQEEAEANQASSNTVSIPTRSSASSSSPSFPRQSFSTPSSSSSFPRLPFSPPPTRVVSPVASSSSGPRSPGSPSYSPARTARLPSAPVSSVSPSSSSSNREPQEAPTMLSFGGLPPKSQNNQAVSPNTSGSGFQTVSLGQSSQNNPFEPDLLLAQQEQAFLSGKSQFMVEAGQTLSGTLTQQILANQDAVFTVRSSEGVLGLPAGTEFVAKVTQLSGKYIMAEAEAIRHIDGTQTMIPPSAVTLSDSNGKLLQAKSNQGFFQSALGKGLLGAGSGLAEQFTSRSESFSQTEFGSTITRGEGSRDLASLGSSALKGFTDPLLEQAGQGADSSALLLNSGQKVRLNINASFVVSQ